MARCWGRNDDEVWTEMNRSSWAEGKALGIRFYVTLAMYMPYHAARSQIKEMCRAIDRVLSIYRNPDILGCTFEWFFEFQDAAWEGLWEHTYEYCKELDNGLVDDIGGGTDYF